MASLVLQVQHDGSQGFIRHFMSPSQVTDIVILAKIAEQVAVGEENGTRAMVPDQGGFFSKVGSMTGYFGPSPGQAHAFLSGQAVHSTQPGTGRTVR
jgi:hypothetical protein